MATLSIGFHDNKRIRSPCCNNSNGTAIGSDPILPQWQTNCFFFVFFKKIFGAHESFLWGHWYPCFGLLVTSPLGFKARVGSALFELSGGVHVTLHVPWDSPLVWHLPTSWQPAWQPSHLFHIPASHWWDSSPVAIMPPLTVWDQADALPTELSRLGSWKTNCFDCYLPRSMNTWDPFTRWGCGCDFFCHKKWVALDSMWVFTLLQLWQRCRK